MREISKRKRKIVFATSPDEYEKAFEEAMNEIGAVETSVIDCGMKDGHYLSIIEYNVTMPGRAEMTIKDEFHLNGIRYTCSNCPHMAKPKDGRYKTAACPFSKYGVVRIDEEACDLFYTKLANHEIEPVEA